MPSRRAPKPTLAKIWAYTLKHWGEDQALTYIQQINRDMQAVAREPARGWACPEIRPGYHRYPTGSHVIFYKPTECGIDAIRILHGSMDTARHIKPATG